MRSILKKETQAFTSRFCFYAPQQDLKGLIDLAQGIESDKRKLSDLKMSIQRTTNLLGERNIENNAAFSKIEVSLPKEFHVQ